ncbi:hypothetical protein QWY85_16815 [Neolewinella lacunae]|uniref:Uncharacterized protein n=1 Tax=Neolewinella lacunae TaxID=1517758 RepID=A0A923T793_9BACT|nr:hypothetical protein [Neolewinella lacunae]MBC6993339.1 hypothetical protein [Neolewinella lacunae]MDN3636329.1 hypothetical protein [Neolewinella lacunae]
MYRFLTFLVLSLLVSAGLYAQNQSFTGYIEGGDQAMERNDHYNAFRLYDIAADPEWEEDRAYEERIAEVYYKAGVAAYRATAYREAEKYMLQLQSRPEITKYPLVKYFMGQSAFRQGNYDQAAANFQLFLDEQPNAPEEYRSAALAQINDSNWAIDALARSEDVILQHMPEGLNTENSDVMYVRGPNGTRYFTSNNFEFKKDTVSPKRQLSRILRQTGERTAVPLLNSINLPGKNVAHTAFNLEMTQVYYSVCDFRNYDELICDLYRADIGADGEWANPVKLDLNVAGYSTTQPSIGLDATDGGSFLYFASDRPGGMGGLDLYRAALAPDGSLGAPANLDKLNTAGDDASPFWYGPRQTLYFATDGRFTFGGLDIYKSYLIDGRFRRPVNLGNPVNSSADEAYYTRFDDPDQAYVASRRPVEEALFYSEERDVCCYDLYEFTPDPRLDLQALTFNKLTGKELPGATVALYKITPTGPELIEEITNLEDNEFNFLVEPGGKYELKATKDGFTEDLDAFDLASPELKDLSFIERRLELNPKVNLDIFTFNNVDLSELTGATVSLYEVNEDGTLTLVREITNPIGNDSHFDLEIGKNYRIEARKDGFGQAYTEVDLRNYSPDQGGTIRRDLYLGQTLEVYVIDGRTDDPLNNATLRLSKSDGELVDERSNPTGNDFYYTVNLDQPFILNTRREGYFPRTDTLVFTQQDLVDGGGKLIYYVPLFSDNLNDFLPFEVYFDNDHPDPRTTSFTTRLSYDETYEPYIGNEEIFKKEAGEGLPEEDAFIERGNIAQFFEQEVKTGYKQLQRFADALIQHMRSGRSFNLELQGSASPRAETEYNRRLSGRRITSVKNFLATYRDGALLPYIKNKQLTYTESALGESTAKLAKIYERLDQVRESIYSQPASLERRVVLRAGLNLKK